MFYTGKHGAIIVRIMNYESFKDFFAFVGAAEECFLSS